MTENAIRQGQPENINDDEHRKSERSPMPRYWVSIDSSESMKINNWFWGFKNVSAVTNERTFLGTILPKSGVGHSVPLIISKKSFMSVASFQGMMNSLVFDYIVRQKVGGINITYNYVQQFPVLPPENFEEHINYLLPKILELTYTSWDIKAFADDLWRESDAAMRALITRQWEESRSEVGGHEWEVPEWSAAYPEISWDRESGGCPLPPFRWDEPRRARLRAQLDALYARLYGLTRDELRYILDPQELYGPDFPGETFRVLKDKEMRLYGEYRTGRLVMEAWGDG